MTIKNVRYESHDDYFSGAYGVVDITIPDDLAEKIPSLTDSLKFQRERFGLKDTFLSIPAIFVSISNENHSPLMLCVDENDIWFEVGDGTGLATTEKMSARESVRLKRFLLQDGGDNIYQWQDGLDDDTFDPMDFTLIYANNLEEAINQFKSLNPIQQ
jgi:hypothetical protein